MGAAEIDGEAPRRVYQGRLENIGRELALLTRRDGLFANLRLGVFMLALLWALLSWQVHPLWLLSVAAPLAVFVLLLVLHERTLRRKRRAEILKRYYDDGLARLEDRWMDRGDTGGAFLSEDHPFAADLDLFGEGSLFQLISRARTGIGAATLAQWLLQPAPRAEIEGRQAAVLELKNRLDLREDLALEGLRFQADVEPDLLIQWAQAPRVLPGPGFLRLSQGLAVLGVLSLVPMLSLGVYLPAVGMLALNLLVLASAGRALKTLGASLEKPRRELAVLAGVLRRLEQEAVQSNKLSSLHGRLSGKDGRASAALAQLDRLVYLYELQVNQLFAPLAVLLLWGVQVGYRIDAWRAQWGRHLPEWLDALGQLEALGSLASFAYEREDAVFPQISEEETVYEAAGIGHPLLARTACVRNDVHLDGSRPLMIISGSNMSGKSTLMRTVGINLVLAMAGAPVCAQRLRVSLLIPGATMRVHDSIQGGVSRFYAEIKRLKQLLDMAKAGDGAEGFGLLFLLDEILHGTNSHDRRIGAEAILGKLLEHGAIGLVSTHDLAITALDTSLKHPVLNAHFEDTVGESGPVFDYTLRPGVVQRSNALALMRTVGLEV